VNDQSQHNSFKLLCGSQHNNNTTTAQQIIVVVLWL